MKMHALNNKDTEIFKSITLQKIMRCKSKIIYYNIMSSICELRLIITPLLMMLLTIPMVLTTEWAKSSMKSNKHFKYLDYSLFDTHYIKQNEKAINQHISTAPKYEQLSESMEEINKFYLFKYSIIDEWDKIINEAGNS